MSKRKLKKRYNRQQSSRAKSNPIALEERIVFDAVLPVIAGDVLDLDYDTNLNNQAELVSAKTDTLIIAEIFNKDVAKADQKTSPERELIAGTLAPTDLSAAQIIFIDAAVDDLEQYLSKHPDADVVLLDANSDGVEQIANVLHGRTNIDAIHILSHGSAGSLNLGNSQLTAESMTGTHFSALNTVKSALSQGADILIYGCDFAAASDGRYATYLLTLLTEADVAASDDKTGAEHLGGDWNLEYQQGQVEALSIDNDTLKSHWHSVLSEQIVNEQNGAVSGTHTISEDGQITITITGADGGDGSAGTKEKGGAGATISGTFNIVAGDVIRYVTGEASANGNSAGGGGSTGVYINSTLVLVAGGGGGGDNSAGAVGLGANTTTNGDDVVGGSGTANSGTNGNGGAGEGAGGGGGINSAGINGPVNSGGGQADTTVLDTSQVLDLAPGGAGNGGASSNGGRGFTGGGGGSKFLSGGGGGYSGGAGTGTSTSSSAGGGGSYIHASAVASNAIAGADGGGTGSNGSIVIDFEGDTDTDGDGILDINDIDDDNDGILDVDEGLASVAPSSINSITNTTVSSTASATANAYPGATTTGYVITDNSSGNTLSLTAIAPQDGNGFDVPSGAVLEGAGIGTISKVTFQVDVADNEHLDSTSLSMAIDGFDDGLYIEINGVVVVSFNVNNWENEAPFQNNGLYDTSSPYAPEAWSINSGWEPWGGEGNPAFTIDADGNIALMVDNINGGRDNVLPLITDAMPNPVPTLDFISGVTIGTAFNNGNGDGYIAEQVVTFTGTILADRDTDGDGVFDHQDIDSDNDGITDNVEAQSTAGYIAPSGQGAAMIDANQNGLDDNYEAAAGTAGFNANGIGLAPVNTDGAGNPDYINIDSDNDGLGDQVESGLTAATTTTDTDGDGLLNDYEGSNVNDGYEVNDENIIGDNGGTDGQYSAFNLIDNDLDTNANEATANRATNDATALANDLDYRDDIIAIDDAITTNEDNAVAANPLSNNSNGADYIPNPHLTEAVRITTAPSPAQGSLSYQLDGTGAVTTVTSGLALTVAEAATLMFNPTANFSGTVAIPYTLKSASNSTETATITITVNEVNDAPVATAVATSGDEDTDISLNLAGTDIDGTIASVKVIKLPLPAEGILYLADGTTAVTTAMTLTPAQAAGLVFKPVANFHGAVTPIEFTVTDNDGATSSTANANITVNDINDAPVATAVTTSGDEDTDITLNLAGTDVDGTIASVNVTALPLATEGVLYLADGITAVTTATALTPAQAADLVFKPEPNFHGAVTPITFTVTDNDGSTSPVANANITVNDINDAPVATAITTSGDEDTDISLNLAGTDVDGTIASVTVTALPLGNQGVLYLADGTTPVTEDTALTPAQAAGLVFKPAPNFHGAVTTITFTVTDDDGAASPEANANITVNDVNDAPTANAKSLDSLEDQDVIVDLLGSDIDGTIASVKVTQLPTAAEGVLYLNDGTTAVTTAMTLTPVQAANLIFKPTANYVSTSADLVDIQFTVTDDDNAVSTPASFVIDVTNVNDSPTATPVTTTTPEDTPVTFTIDGTDIDPAPDDVASISVTTLPPPEQGILYLADGTTKVVAGVDYAPGNFVFSPAPNYHGTVNAIPFTVKDTLGQPSAPGAINLSVNDVNDDPVATAITTSGDEDTDIALNLAGTDVDGTIASVNVTALPPEAEGKLYLADGTTLVTTSTALTPAQAASLVFKPAPNFHGAVTPITFTVTDDDGATSPTANANITVNDINDDPLATAVTSSGNEDTDIALNLAGTDVDGTIISVSVTTLPPATQGILYLADGTTPVTLNTALTPAQAASLVFKPAANYHGTVTPITFTVTDDDGATSPEADADITVNDINDAPVATAVTTSGDEDTDIALNLAGTDVDGTIASVNVTALPPEAEGKLYLADCTTAVTTSTALTPAQAASLVFKPEPNFHGAVTAITFTVTDDDGATSPVANANITVNDVNDDPVATAITTSGDEDTDIALNLAGTDVDGTIASVKVSKLPLPAEGTLYLADGSTAVTTAMTLTPAQAAGLVFKPVPNFHGSVTPIEFTVTDDDGATSSTANANITVNDINDAPVATAITTSGDEDTDISLNLAGTDVDGTIASVNITALPPESEGKLYLADGITLVTTSTALTPAQAASLVFKPAANFHGTVTPITFTVTDDDGTTSLAANANITVNDVNDAPVATAVSASGNEDTDIALTLAGSDVDGTVDSVTVTTLPPADEGKLYLADGTTPVNTGVALTPAQAASLVFKPPTNFRGTVTAITFTVTDNDGGTSPEANANISVNDINDAPLAIAKSVDRFEDQDVNVDLMGSDVDGTIVSVKVTQLPTAAEGVLYLSDGTTAVTTAMTLTPAQAANLIFTPTPNYVTTPADLVDIQFTVTDDDNAVSTAASFVIDVNNVNDSPIATPVTTTTPEDTAVTFTLDGTDIDPAPDDVASISVTNLPPPEQGVLYLADGTSPVVAGVDYAPGSFVFDPAPNFHGVVSPIPFTVKDTLGQASAQSAINITVNDVNDAPVATAITTSGDEDTDISLNLAGSDIDGTIASVNITALPPEAEGKLYLADGTTLVTTATALTPAQAASLVFKPAPNFHGTVTTITFTVTDDDGAISAAANANITVNDINDAPVATAVTTSNNEDTDISLSLAGTDVDGTIISVSVTTLPPATEGILYLADGTTPVTLNTALTPAQAASLVFKPAANYHGTVTPITFTVTDDDGATSTEASANMTVNDVNDLPMAIANSIDSLEDQNVAVSLLGTDIDGTITSIKVTQLPTAAEGILYLSDGTTAVTTAMTLSPAQASNLIFNPTANYVSTSADLVDIVFTVTDDDNAVSSTANFVIDVDNVNDSPLATPVTTTTPEDTAVTFTLDGTDIDPAPDEVVSINVTTLPPPEQGVLYLADGTTPVVAGVDYAPGSFVFDPTPNFHGVVSAIPFTVKDTLGQVSAASVVNLSVDDVNDDPVATALTTSGDEDSDITLNLSGSDVDGTVDSITITTLPPAEQGKLYLADGTTLVNTGTPLTPTQAAGLIFKPAPNYHGTVAPIKFIVTDGDGGVSQEANANMTVNDVNDDPVANAVANSGDEDTNITVNLAGSDVDGTVDSITITALPPAQEGVLYFADGTTPVNKDVSLTPAQTLGLIFKPAPNFHGNVTAISFTVTDDDGATSPEANANITVNDVNDAPVATPLTSNGNEENEITLNLGGTDPNDPQGSIASVTVTTLPPESEGVLYLAGGTTPVLAGTPLTPAQAAGLVFKPAPNYHGTVTPISFNVTDDDGATSTEANANITINEVNDIPIARAVTNSGDEDTNITINLAGIDVDGTVDSITITTLPPAEEGVLYLADGNTAVLAGTTFTPAQTLGLIFKPAPNFNGNVAPISFTVTDDDGATSLAANANITINDINDAPVASNSNVQVFEDTNLAVSLTGSDIDGTVDTVTVTTLPAQTAGILYLSDGITPVTLNTSISASQAQNLIFKPAPNYITTGTSQISINFIVTDNEGGVSAPAAFNMTPIPVSDAPAGSDNTITIDEDATYTLTVADFGFSDANDAPADNFSNVIITALPDASEGEYRLNGTTVTDNDVISVLDIAAGKVSYTPAQNSNGTGLGAIGFAVQDDGSTANGGVVIDPTPNTINFNISALPDAPVHMNPVTVPLNDRFGVIFTGDLTVSVTDPEVDVVSTKLTVIDGDITVTLASGASISAGANGSPSFTISGTQAAINASLATLTYQAGPSYTDGDKLTLFSEDATTGTPLTDTDTVTITGKAEANNFLFHPVEMVETTTEAQVLTAESAHKAYGIHIAKVVRSHQYATAPLSLSDTTLLGYDDIALTNTPVPDPPVHSIPETVVLDDRLRVNFTQDWAVSVDDPQDNVVSTKLTVKHGDITVTLAPGASISAGANTSSSLTISGTQAAINASLATLTYEVGPSYTDSDTLTLFSQDATDGDSLTDVDKILITIEADAKKNIINPTEESVNTELSSIE